MKILNSINGESLGDQLFYHKNKPDPNSINPIKNVFFVKAAGGMWTSTFENGISDWINWCNVENYSALHDNSRKWLLSPRKSNLLFIDNLPDLAAAYDIYKLEFTLLEPFHMLDFEKIAQDYDGIHLSAKGQFSTRLSHPLSLYGWDCESTHWFSWKFTDDIILLD